MYLSVRDNPELSRRKVEVFLDGVEQKRVIEADDVNGFIRRYVTKDGKPVVQNGELQTETLSGKVVIVMGTLDPL
jgi:hypothetical protein